MGRRYDPDRRQRIIDAAIRVVGRSGIAGLSHRTVAAEAEVPLGSTTYHFTSLDELLVAALRRSDEGFAAVVRDSGTLADPVTARALVALVDGICLQVLLTDAKYARDAGADHRLSRSSGRCRSPLAAVARPEGSLRRPAPETGWPRCRPAG